MRLTFKFHLRWLQCQTSAPYMMSRKNVSLLDFCIQFEVEVGCKIWGHAHEKNAVICVKSTCFVFIARWRTLGVMIASGVDLGSSNNYWEKMSKKSPDIDLVADPLPFCGNSWLICAHITAMAAVWGSKCGIMGCLEIQLSWFVHWEPVPCLVRDLPLIIDKSKSHKT